jgi:hypothetical protein
MSVKNKAMKTKYIATITGRTCVSLFSLLILIIVASGCQKNFEKFNTDQTGISNANLDITTVFKPLQHEIFHNYQTGQNLSSDGFGGYMMSPTPFKAAYDLNYFLVDGWDSNGFNDMYTYIFAPVNKIASVGTKKSLPDFWAIALIVKVEAMHRVTDKFGPIPYSQVGKSLVATPYDSQQSVYNQFFLELDTAVNTLQTYVAANPGKTPFQNYDLIYNGDYTKWIKFANSLRLRLAMHIVKADPATAKLQGEKALANTGGLMSSPSDDAAITVTTGTSDLYTITHDWGDNRLNATMGTYLTGYNDPRLSIYAAPATDAALGGKYTGIRIGTAIAAKDDYEGYASLNTSTTFTPLKAEQIMCAAESWFLKAEAGLRGWTGAGDPQTNYEQGVQVSMQQWGASVGGYLSDATSTQAAYADPKNAANNSAAVSSITIKWDAGATNEQKLERIMTQKWLAMFPEGQEAWTEFRRTGYPKLFTVVNNKSNGTIDTQIQVRRLAYPQNEYSTNGAAVQAAVQSLGGADNGGTRLWWDVNKANF